MARRFFLIAASLLAFAGLEVAGNALWPTQCSRCAPLRYSAAHEAPPQSRSASFDCDSAGEGLACRHPVVQQAGDR